ncbi:MAG: LysR family transcriptional regulator [Clostridia bacterium]|nr:LysR family transcriptional regulator [Clostridia bacterium]
MNLQQLKQIIEVEKTASITQAAKNLYMGQPNLSKSIKELENELGIILFKRTVKGVEATGEGLQFLRHAKEIVGKVEELESLYKPTQEKSFQFKISVPRATYISLSFSNFLNQIDKTQAMDIRYKETNPLDTIDDVASGESTLGIIRYQNIYEDYFLNLLKENHLHYEEIGSYHMCLLMSKHHPLATYTTIPYLTLSKYIEIVHGDFQVPALSPERMEKMKKLQEPQRRIHIYDRASQFDLLQNVEGAYLWVSPLPFSEPAKYGLIQKECSDAGINKDVVIYGAKEKLTEYETTFIELLKQNFKKSNK